jgi:hypothetical protein
MASNVQIRKTVTKPGQRGGLDLMSYSAAAADDDDVKTK